MPQKSIPDVMNLDHWHKAFFWAQDTQKSLKILLHFTNIYVRVEKGWVYEKNLLKNQNLNYHSVALPQGKYANVLFVWVHDRMVHGDIV